MTTSNSIQQEPSDATSFVDDAHPDAAPPPTYYQSLHHKKAASSGMVGSSWPTSDFHFFKATTFSSKARIRSTDGREFRLEADVSRHKDSTISLYAGKDIKGQSNTCLGSVSFPPSHNNFRIHTSGAKGSTAPAEMIQVKARIGHPHPISYTFNLPPVDSNSRSKEVVWNRVGSSPSNFGYRLDDTTWKTPIASWNLVQGEKHDVVLRWHEEPRSQWEEVIVLLSFIGCMTRMKLKGREDDSMLRANGRARWGAFWFMAVLGTAAAGDF